MKPQSRIRTALNALLWTVGAIALAAITYALIPANGAAQAQEAAPANTPVPSGPPPDDGGGAVGGASGQNALSKPTNLTGVGGDGTITLDWDTVTGATTYEVVQWDGHVSSPDWLTLPFTSNRAFDITFSGSSAVVSGLENGVTYSHHVRAKNANGNSPWSEIQSTLAGVIPSVPTNFRAAAGSGSIDLVWDAVAHATAYEVQQWDGYVIDPEDEDEPRWRPLPFNDNSSFTIEFSESSAKVRGLIKGTTYSHRIRSANGSNLKSDWSDYVHTTAPAPLPDTPLPNRPPLPHIRLHPRTRQRPQPRLRTRTPRRPLIRRRTLPRLPQDRPSLASAPKTPRSTNELS